MILLDAVVVAGLAVERRFPRTHDGYEFLLFQYYLLNGAVTAGEIPQWVPFTSQGMDATWFYTLASTLPQQALYLVAPVLRHVNFLWLFYLAAFVDEMVLFAGVWLLARRFMASRLAVTFTAVAALGSAVWMDQPWLNFQFSRSVPLILVLLHEFLERGRWRYLAAAGNLLALQMLGNMIYALPVTTFVIVLYVASWLVLDPTARRHLTRLRPGWPAAGAVAVGVVSLLLVALAMTAGTDQTVSYSVGRDAGGRTTLDMFLRYGGNIKIAKWVELGLRVSPAVDYTLYVGILTLPLAALGVWLGLRRANAHLLVVLVVTFLFSAGTLVAAAVYHVWPLMHYFRHIGAASTFPKLLLCVFAGLGVDALLRGPRTTAETGRFTAGLAGAAAMTAVASVGLAALAWAGGVAVRVKWHVVDGPGAYGGLLGEAAVRTAVVEAAILALVGSVLLAGMMVPRLRRPLVVGALVITALDVFTYKAAQSRIQAFPLADHEAAHLGFAPVPWIARRCPAMPCRPSERFDALRPWTIPPGEHYWSTSAFVYDAELGSSMRVVFWPRPFDDVLRGYAGQPIADKRQPPPGWRAFGPLPFPRHPVAEKLAGRTEDTIQFFSAALVAPDDEAVAAELRRPGATGDVLLLRALDRAGDTPLAAATAWTPQPTPPAGTRLRLPYRVERFDANDLVVRVDTGPEAPAWLMYSDMWHPSWSATVNGRPVSVFKANLAYKAVPLERGVNRVHFRFAIPGLAPAYLVLGVNALAWLAALAVMFVIRVTGVEERPGSAAALPSAGGLGGPSGPPMS